MALRICSMEVMISTAVVRVSVFMVVPFGGVWVVLDKLAAARAAPLGLVMRRFSRSGLKPCRWVKYSAGPSTFCGLVVASMRVEL